MTNGRTKNDVFARSPHLLIETIRFEWLPAALLLALAALWFAIRALHGIHFLSFGDESGHLLGARALRAGDKLYRDFIDAHGPLSFMAAQTFGVIFGWKEPLNARWGIVVLVIFAAMAIYKSPTHQHTTSRMWGAAIFLGLVSAPWLIQSLYMVNYHILGGVLITVVLAGTIMPALFNKVISKRSALLSGFCLALLCAAAYSLAPTAVLLVASAACALWDTSNRATLKTILANILIGFAAGLLAILTWMLCFGDIVGYLVFHIISNQVNYSRYSGYGWKKALGSLVPSDAPDALVQSSATMTFGIGLILLVVLGIQTIRIRPVSGLLSIIFLTTAILMTNFRGAFGFQNGSFLVSSIAIFALTLPTALIQAASSQNMLKKVWIGSVFIGLILCIAEIVDRGAATSPRGLSREQFVQLPKRYLRVDYQTPIYQRIRSILKPNERLLVLVYNPDFFLPAGFLPVRKFHEYLPWEADYARDPWFGRTRDLCADISANPPPVIVYVAWKVWGVWPPETFMPCVPQLLKQKYVADEIPSLYIRRDRMYRAAKP